MVKGQSVLFCLSVFLFLGSDLHAHNSTPLDFCRLLAAAMAEVELAKGEKRPAVVEPIPNHEASISALAALNRQLEAMPPSFFSRRNLMQLGLIKDGAQEVHRPDHGSHVAETLDEGESQHSTSGPQLMPFTELLLPFAKTGIYVPKKGVSEEHQGILILLPGVGTEFSVAKTLFDTAITFHGKKSKNRGRERDATKSHVLDAFERDGKKFRFATFPLDLPLNGMGSEAPREFFHENGVVEVIRHAHLILKGLYQRENIYLGGRSQGGLSVLSYASAYRDFSGVIAINPSHTAQDIVTYSITGVENNLAVITGSDTIQIHQPSWNAYKEDVPQYRAYEIPSHVPVLVMLGDQDPSYPQPHYIEQVKKFALEQPDMREAEVFSGPHNLWDRKDNELYQRVIFRMAQFMEKNRRSGLRE